MCYTKPRPGWAPPPKRQTPLAWHGPTHCEQKKAEWHPAKVRDDDSLEEDLPLLPLTPFFEELPTGPGLTLEMMHAGLGQFAAHHDRLLIAHGKLGDKLIDAEEERDMLRSRVTELEADKTGDMAMESVSKGDMVELQAKVAEILKDVPSYITIDAIKNTSAEAVLMRAEFLKVKASVIMQQPGTGEVHQEGAGNFADTLKGPGPSACPTMEQFLKVRTVG